MRQARAGHDTRGQRVTPRCRWAAGPGRASSRRAERSSRRGRLAGGPPPTGTHSDQTPLVWRAPEGPEGTGGLRDDALSHTQQHGAAGVEGAGGSGGHGRASRQRTETHTSMPVAADVEGAGGPGCGARGRRRGLAGLRDDAPSEARGAGGSRAGRRPREQPAARPSRARKAPGPTTHHAAPTTPAAPQETQHRGAGPQARAPSATTQTRVLRSTDVPCRSARAARQWRRSSRSLRLRRRAGPRR